MQTLFDKVRILKDEIQVYNYDRECYVTIGQLTEEGKKELIDNSKEYERYRLVD